MLATFPQAVIYEGLRLRPHIPPYDAQSGAPPRATSSTGIFLPGGTAVGWNLLAMLRNEGSSGEEGKKERKQAKKKERGKGEEEKARGGVGEEGKGASC